ncbi:DUF6236 family protein [Pseudoalteromonas sp. SYSU M81236]|uniref:DUF6236 family protein n=1 Tax=Pseudoalteromonas sp. SYSU M81236 TaxID=3447014 RepID=UPI003EFC69C6
MEKGIILAPKVTPGRGNGHHGTIHEKMDLNDLRFALLFWDKFDVTCYEQFSYRSSPGWPNPNQELDLLIKEGLAFVDESDIDLNKVTTEPLYIQDVIALKPYAVLQKYLEKNDTDWSFFQTSGGLYTPDKCATQQDTIEFQLMNMLPVPRMDVPICEVLEFKQKRADELNELRNTIYELVSRVCNAEQTEKEATRVKDKLAFDLESYNKVITEFNSRTVLKGLNQIVTNPINAYPGAVSAIATILGQIPNEVSASFGIAALSASAVNFASKKQNVYSKLPNHLYKYAYLAHASDDLM